MNKLIKYTLILVFIFTALFSLTGCYDSHGLEKIAYAIAIGIDKGTDNNIKLSIQYNVSQKEGSNKKESSSSSSSTSNINTIECSSINNGISLLNNYISKKTNLSHCKIIVFSAEIASQGIEEHITTLTNNIEVRPDCDVIISKCNAQTYLEFAKPIFETETSKYFEIFLDNTEYSGYTTKITLNDFYSNLYNDSKNAVAILGNLNIKENKDTINSTEYRINKSPIENSNSIENIGLAVFNGYKLVGELDNLDTVCYLILTNRLENSILSIPNPFSINDDLDLDISLKKPTTTKTELINNSPYITSNVYIKANILSSNANSDYSKLENIKIIEEYVSSYLNNLMYDFLYKTSIELKADIIGFGVNLLPKYSTIDKWQDLNWLSNYKNSIFKVNIDSTVNPGNLFMKN